MLLKRNIKVQIIQSGTPDNPKTEYLFEVSKAEELEDCAIFAERISGIRVSSTRTDNDSQ